MCWPTNVRKAGIHTLGNQEALPLLSPETTFPARGVTHATQVTRESCKNQVFSLAVPTSAFRTLPRLHPMTSISRPTQHPVGRPPPLHKPTPWTHRSRLFLPQAHVAAQPFHAPLPPPATSSLSFPTPNPPVLSPTCAVPHPHLKMFWRTDLRGRHDSGFDGQHRGQTSLGLLATGRPL